MLIDGKWVDPKSGADNSFHVYNPATGEVMATVAAGDHADVDLAVKAARRALEQGPWSRITHGQRGKLVWKLADLIEENLEESLSDGVLSRAKALGATASAKANGTALA
jgi:phenylacetaldehyde dehydrogenase